MSSFKIISETPVTMAELKEDFKRIQKRDEELGLRSGKTLDYLNLFVEIKSSEAKELYKKIEDLGIPRLKPEHIVKVIDLLPGTVEEVKTIFSGQPLTINNDNCKKLVDAVKDYKKVNKEDNKEEKKE